MTEEPKKTRGGSKLSRSEVTTVRLDPKLRYLAELAARKQRRTLSSFIEWAIEDSLNRFNIRESNGLKTTLQSQAENLWDVDEADRFAKLAFNFPELLTHDEQIVWKLVRENGALWNGWFRDSDGRWVWNVSEDYLLFQNLRTHWSTLKAVAAGEMDASALPTWKREDPDAVAPF